MRRRRGRQVHLPLNFGRDRIVTGNFLGAKPILGTKCQAARHEIAVTIAERPRILGAATRNAAHRLDLPVGASDPQHPRVLRIDHPIDQWCPGRGEVSRHLLFPIVSCQPAGHFSNKHQTRLTGKGAAFLWDAMDHAGTSGPTRFRFASKCKKKAVSAWAPFAESSWP